MATPSWLDDVRQELVKRRVCATYRERLLTELRDHIDDLRCEERNHAMSTETWDGGALTSRLGQPKEIATAVESHAMPVRFARRHPLITYLLTPIPALIVLWVAYVAGLIGIANAFESYKDAAWAVQLAGILVHGIAYVPPVVLTLVIAWVADSQPDQARLVAHGAPAVAIVSGMMMVSLTHAHHTGHGPATDWPGIPSRVVPLAAVPDPPGADRHVRSVATRKRPALQRE